MRERERIPWWKRLIVAAALAGGCAVAMNLLWAGVLPHSLIGLAAAFCVMCAFPTVVALIVRMPRSWWRLPS